MQQSYMHKGVKGMTCIKSNHDFNQEFMINFHVKLAKVYLYENLISLLLV